MALPQEESTALRETAFSSSQLTEVYLNEPDNRRARIKALTAAKKLVLELQTGDDAFFYRLEQGASNQVLRFMKHLGVLEAVPTTGSISAADLAAALKAEVTLVIRLMRLLCATGVFEEVSQDSYAHTKRSLNLIDPGYGHFFDVMMDEIFNGCLARFNEYFASHPLSSPDNPRFNPYSFAFGMEGHDWHEVVSRTPESLKRFSIGLNGRWQTVPASGIYPFDTQLADRSKRVEEDNGVLIVDVGGAQGGSMKEVREAHPGLKGRIVIQDQPRVINSIPDGHLPADIEAQIYDFWEPQPVKAEVYYLRRVLHDWPDFECTKILQRQVDAMGPDSIILVAELAMPDRIQMEDTYAYWMDMTMFTFGGKERSRTDWKKLFDSAGLELVKVWKAPVGTQAVMEGKKKSI